MAWFSDLLQGIPLNAVLRERMAIAEQKIKDIEAENGRLKEEVAALTKEKDELKRQIERIPVAAAPPVVTPTFRKGMYFKGDDGPFCTACYDTNSKLVRVADATRDQAMVMGILHTCPVCKARYAN